jgi:hypothetical protein
MALKRKYKSQEEIPSEHSSLYVERGGEWLLEVEGSVAEEEFARVQSDLERLNTERAQLRTELHVARTEEAAVLEARRLGIRPGAETDLRNRARAELTLDEQGNPAKRAAGGKLVAIAVSDWVREQSKDAAHLFSEGEGTGAAGVRAPGVVHTGPNPWDADIDNWTQQSQIERQNPELAASLKKSARR